MSKKFLNNLNYFFIFILIIFASYLSFVGGYGSDEDTLPMIGTFEAILNSGAIMTSRFTGYPVAEFGIGFLSYNFGSFAANIATFLLLIISLIFIFLTFNADNKNLKYLLPLFLLLCLTNPIIFFDNIEPIDYSWSLAPFAIGCYFFKKRVYELSLLFFCLSIGARLNFALFIIIFIFLYNNNDYTLKKRIIFIICTLFLGSLFYLPTWYIFKFSFDWVSAARPIEQGLYGLIGRFIYKVINLFTPLSLIFIFIIIINKNFLLKFFKDRVIFFIFISNLLLFLWIPAELSYLLLGLIIFYFFLIKNFSTKKILILILLNFSTWFVQFDFLEIKYKDKINECSSPNAIGANLKFKVKDGSIMQFIDTRDKIKCWLEGTSLERKNKILRGDALK